ncbi:MAG: GNAT family N-acetyltransferase [Actinomycetaceae bacterium]|nr:GNAT family N-acetyltransferase [Actinomycetaceae bacterium]
MSSGILQAPRKLEKSDNRADFFSGAPDLDDWFHRYAWQNQRANNSVTYITTLDSRVVGYYALAAAGVSAESVDPDFAKHRPKDIPCVLLARLAVDKRAQGKRVGVSLLQDAMRRAFTTSESIGAAALLIHCRDDNARKFYMHHIDLLESPLQPLQLLLPLKQLKLAIGK